MDSSVFKGTLFARKQISCKWGVMSHGHSCSKLLPSYPSFISNGFKNNTSTQPSSVPMCVLSILYTSCVSIPWRNIQSFLYKRSIYSVALGSKLLHVNRSKYFHKNNFSWYQVEFPVVVCIHVHNLKRIDWVSAYHFYGFFCILFRSYLFRYSPLQFKTCRGCPNATTLPGIGKPSESLQKFAERDL